MVSPARAPLEIAEMAALTGRGDVGAEMPTLRETPMNERARMMRQETARANFAPARLIREPLSSRLDLGCRE